MKKSLNKVIVTLAAVAALSMAMGATALADVTADLDTETGVAAVTYTRTVSPNEEVTVLVLKPNSVGEGEAVEAEDIAFIDQKTADSNGDVTFSIKLADVEEGQVYDIKSGSAEGETIAEDEADFGTTEEAIHYGDPTGEGDIDTSDALEIIKYYVGDIDMDDATKLRADVTREGSVDTTDALEIIKYYVGDDCLVDDSWK